MKHKTYFIKDQKGQSLIELSVAVSLISIALLAIVSLVTVGIVAQRRSVNYYIAINLAREAIEVARNSRDTNWLKIEKERQSGTPVTNWDDNLREDNIYSAILRFNPDDVFADTQSKFIFDFIEIEQDAIKTIHKKNSEDPDTAVYLDPATCPLCEATIFKRLVNLKPICDNTGPNSPASLDNCDQDPSLGYFICDNNGQCSDDAPKIGIRVIVEMQWQEGGRTQNLELADDIYNWR